MLVFISKEIEFEGWDVPLQLYKMLDVAVALKV